MNLDPANAATPLAVAQEPATADPARTWRDNHFYEERSRLNAELAALQRELAWTNAEMAATRTKLEASEQRYRSLTACSPVGIFELDAAGRCLYTNPYWQAISGLTAEESLGDGWQRVLDQRDAPDYLKARNLALRAGREFDREVRFVNTRGDRRWAHVRSRVITAGDGKVTGRVCAVEDITERKNTEDDLRWKTGLLESYVNNSIDGILVTDHLGRKLLQNQRVAGLFKIPPAIAEDHDDTEQLAWVGNSNKDPEQFLARVTYLCAHPQEISRDEIELKDGTVLDRYTSPVTGADGTYYGRLWTFRDITQSKQAEAKLRQLSHAVEQSPVSIVISDLLGGIEYVNPKFCALTGYSFAEIRGKNPRLLKSGSMPPENYRQLWAALTAGQEWHGEFHNRKKNGELYWESASISSIRDDQGKITHFVAIKEDITERRRVSAALSDSQQNLALATESAHIGIWDWDLVANRKNWDARMYALYGIREQDISNPIDAWQKSLHPADRNRVEAEIAAALGGINDYNTEYRILWPNGEVRYIEAHALVRRSEDGFAARMIGVNWDITERKRADGVLKEQLTLRDRLAKIAAVTPGIIYSFRLRPDGSTCMPYASPTIEDFFGVSAEVLVKDAMAVWNLIHPDDLVHVRQSTAESARTLLLWRTEFRVRHPKKGLFWVEGQASPEREADGGTIWHGFMSDISERKMLEAQMVQQRTEHEIILNSIGDGVHWIDASGLIRFENPAAARMLGYEAAELIGRPAHPTMHHTRADGSAYPQGECHIYETLRDRAVRRVADEVFWRKDGTSFAVDYSCTPVYERDGRPGGAVVIFSDITERKQAQADRETLERRVAEHRVSEENARLALVHQQKLSQIQNLFVSMVSHEFRTPLSIINMAAELLDGYLDKMTGAERSEHLNEIKSSVERLTQMMNDFLIHGNCVNGKMECKPARVPVAALCRRLILAVPECSRSTRAIECIVDPAVGEAWLDQRILGHILGNLLSNAVKYSCDGQPVQLEVKKVAGSPQANGGMNPLPESHLEFKVSDSGIGIPAADLAKLYQTFHRAANVGNRPGTGMGLAIVKQFVDLHLGTIRFESKEGKGTTVWVELPITAPAPPPES